jgi:hypothetical protein
MKPAQVAVLDTLMHLLNIHVLIHELIMNYIVHYRYNLTNLLKYSDGQSNSSIFIRG